MKIVLATEHHFLRTSAQMDLAGSGYRLILADPLDLVSVLAALRAHRPALALVYAEISACSCETLVRIIREDPLLERMSMVVLAELPDSEACLRMARWPGLEVVKRSRGARGIRALVEAHAPL